MTILITAVAIAEAVALVGMFIGWWTAERKAAAAERAANRAERRADRFAEDARRARRNAVYQPKPRDTVDTVTLPFGDFDAKFEQFLNDLRDGR